MRSERESEQEKENKKKIFIQVWFAYDYIGLHAIR